MNLSKIFIIFIFLSAFAFQVSARNGKPNIAWKNLQPKYESFYDIKPTIVNVGEEPVYFNCSLTETNPANLGIKLIENVGVNAWHWNVWQCGTVSKEELKKQRKEEKRIDKLRKQGKHVPSGCKLNPGEEFTFAFNEKIWDYIILGDEVMYQPYKSGKFRFRFTFESVEEAFFIESPEFLVIPKETK
jgi:hypothetical protein